MKYDAASAEIEVGVKSLRREKTIRWESLVSGARENGFVIRVMERFCRRVIKIIAIVE